MFRRFRSRKGKGKDKSKRESQEVNTPSRPSTTNEVKSKPSTPLTPSAPLPPLPPSTHPEPSIPPKSVVLSKPPPQISKSKYYYEAPIVWDSSLSSKATWDVPHLTKTPWELERHKQKRTSHLPHSSDGFPARFFERLPREVYDCILGQLEQIYDSQDQPCQRCYVKDLCNLALTSRAWDKASTVRLYRKIMVLTDQQLNDSIRIKIRLKHLRRTLRDRSALARMVRELHIGDVFALYNAAGIEQEEILNLIASVVMATPSLERVVGFHIEYTEAFDRLSHALSTRRNLKEQLWLLSHRDEDHLYGDMIDSTRYYHAACDPTERFLEMNSRHPLLTTLGMIQETEKTPSCLNYRAIIGTLRSCPALRNLSIVGFAANVFTNLALNSLPLNLHSLRLERLPGVTEKGLQRFFTSQQVTSIKHLTLVEIDLHNLITLSHVFSPQIEVLESFSIVQDKAPVLAGRTSIPTLHSLTVQQIHWEFRSEAGPLPRLPSALDATDSPSFPFTSSEPICCLATSLLASSIRDGLFPSLHRIRIPHDPQGIIQALCRPLATAMLPFDRTTSSPTKLVKRSSHPSSSSPSLDSGSRRTSRSNRYSVPTSTTTTSSRVDSVINSHSPSPTSFDTPELTPARSRIAAQARILAARKRPAFTVKVFAPDGEVYREKGVGGFIGQLGSRIEYDLLPDRGCSAAEGWITSVGDVVGRGVIDGKPGRGGRVVKRCGHAMKEVGSGRERTVGVEELFWRQ